MYSCMIKLSNVSRRAYRPGVFLLERPALSHDASLVSPIERAFDLQPIKVSERKTPASMEAGVVIQAYR